MKKTILKFSRPHVLETDIDGIEILYPYEIQSIKKEKYKLEDKKVENKRIKISISGTLACMWGFDIFCQPEEYKELIKLLFPYALNQIKVKYSEGTLNKFEEILILTTNHPKKRIYNIDEIPEVEGYKEEMDIEEEESKISIAIDSNVLAGEIIQYRDHINVLMYSQENEKLLELDQERNLLEFFKTASTEEEFSYRIASLGSLVGKMNKTLLQKLTSTSDPQLGTIALLGNYIELLKSDSKSIIPTLKHINRFRQAYPIHTDKASGVIEAYKHFKLDYPINDYQNAWLKLLGEYLKALKDLFGLLKKHLMK